MADSFAGQSHIAVKFFSGDFTPKPARRFELAAARLAREFNFRHHQTMIATVINVDLDLKIFPRNFVAGFSQPPPRCGRPQRGKLLRAQPDLAFFPRRPPADLERKGSRFSFFPQPDVPPASFVRQITLRDSEMPRAQDLQRQSFDQKLTFDLARRNVMGPAHPADSKRFLSESPTINSPEKSTSGGSADDPANLCIPIAKPKIQGLWGFGLSRPTSDH